MNKSGDSIRLKDKRFKIYSKEKKIVENENDVKYAVVYFFYYL